MTDWYLHHDIGDDANDGLTPKTAKRTQDALWKLCEAGDTIHGDYFTGFAPLRGLTYTFFPNIAPGRYWLDNGTWRHFTTVPG